MGSMFSPDRFFSLERFAHKSLWQENLFPWEVLHHIEKYLNAFKFQIEIPLPSHVFLIHPEQIAIGEGTTIGPGVCIEVSCILGKNCHIAHGAYIRPGTICGDGCSIGHAAEVKHSVLLDGAKATHFTYVGDSVLGNGVNLGAGVKCANLRLDRCPVAVFEGGVRIETGLKKMGAIVGDFAQVGCNAVLNPGTLVEKGAKLPPLGNYRGLLESTHVS